jgi:RND family efflux transporter MFP subunit
MITPMKPALLLSLLLLAGCGRHAASDEDPKPTAQVTTAAVTAGSIADTVTAYGAAEVTPQGERTLIAPVEAVLARVVAAPGVIVRAGDAVVVLTASPATKLDIEKTAHDAAVAQAAYARALRLRATGLDSDADVETARAAAATAGEASANLQSRSGGALTLRAPIGGVVESVALAPGDQAAAGAAVAKIGDASALRVRLGVEPAAAASIRVGALVRLATTAGGQDRVSQVSGVDPRLDALTRLASVSVLAPPGSGFSPGQPLKGTVVLRERTGVLIVPRAALLYEGEEPYVFVISGGAAHRKPVKLGALDADHVEVVSGVAAGDRVAVDGAAALEDGMAAREGKAADGKAANGAAAKDE